MFSRPAGGAEIFDLIIDVARAGDMVIYAPATPPCLIAEEQRSHLPNDFEDPVFEDPAVVASGAELQEVIERA